MQTTETPLSAPATPENICCLERLTLATQAYFEDSQQYLARLYQRMGAAQAIAGRKDAPVPLVEDDLERLQAVVNILRTTGRHLHEAGRKAEEGRLLLRSLYMGLGRSRALRSLGNDVRVYAEHTTEHAHALPA
ncbi:hypothetical protein ACF1AE_21750 [Streptomyces sp. NPDC014986]|uniref:hypothetical protein n=1 Tax=Streptomyces sp. NPDC014986 TaxID=3364934 RepID=UPI0036F4BA56